MLPEVGPSTAQRRQMRCFFWHSSEGRSLGQKCRVQSRRPSRRAGLSGRELVDLYAKSRYLSRCCGAPLSSVRPKPTTITLSGVAPKTPARRVKNFTQQVAAAFEPRSGADNVPRALVVDDELSNRFILRGQLDQLGFHVSECANDAEAVAASAQTCFDLVFMDVMMPVMDGVAATCILKAHEQQRFMPIIF